MRKFKKRVWDIIGAIGIIVGILLTSYSWATTFSDAAPLIEWRLGVGLGILIFFVSALVFIYKLYGNYAWEDPEITLTAKTNDDDSDHVFYINARLNVYNHEQTPITECYATLVHSADYLEHEHRMIVDPKTENQRIKSS